MLKSRKGQSTVEYLILVGIVIAVIILFLSPTGVFRAAYTNTLTSATNGMEAMADRLKNSRP